MASSSIHFTMFSCKHLNSWPHEVCVIKKINFRSLLLFPTFHHSVISKEWTEKEIVLYIQDSYLKIVGLELPCNLWRDNSLSCLAFSQHKWANCFLSFLFPWQTENCSQTEWMIEGSGTVCEANSKDTQTNIKYEPFIMTCNAVIIHGYYITPT